MTETIQKEGWLVRGRGGVYTAEDEAGNQYVLRAKNRFRHQHITPLVGDLAQLLGVTECPLFE